MIYEITKKRPLYLLSAFNEIALKAYVKDPFIFLSNSFFSCYFYAF